MDALGYKAFGPPEVLVWTPGWPEPSPPDCGVLVRPAAGSINPKDALLRKGRFRRTLAREPLPRISGMDVAGVVVALGKDSFGFNLGDRIFGMTNRFCGGTHAELAPFLETEICPAPANLSLEEAACVPLAGLTALQALRDCCRLKEGQRILINGASGGVGHFAVQMAKAMGAVVHGVCGPANGPFVQALGADQVHNYQDRPARAIDLKFDAVFDVFGKLTRKAFARQLGPKGIYVSTVPKGATLLGEALAMAGLTQTRRLVRVRSVARDLALIKTWIEAGNVTPHLEAIYTRDQAAQAHGHIESRRTRGKIVVRLNNLS